MFDFIKNSKLYFAISGLLLVVSIVLILSGGLKLGIDFTGGRLLHLQFNKERPALSELENSLEKNVDSNFGLKKAGDKGVLVRVKDSSDKVYNQIMETFKKEGEVTERSSDMIGPMIGKELRNNTLTAIMVGFIFIIVYIAWAFHRVSRPVSSFQYGLVALIALFHDIIITCGVVAILTQITPLDVVVNVPFAAALLTLLGYSINDSIVVFDRCRENLIETGGGFKNILNRSLSQIFVRSLLTSLTTLLALFALLFVGAATLTSFVIVLIVGVFFGTYSSIFIATPLLFRFAKD